MSDQYDDYDNYTQHFGYDSNDEYDEYDEYYQYDEYDDCCRPPKKPGMKPPKGPPGKPGGFPPGPPQGKPPGFPPGPPQGKPPGFPPGPPQGKPPGFPPGPPQGKPPGFPPGGKYKPYKPGKYFFGKYAPTILPPLYIPVKPSYNPSFIGACENSFAYIWLYYGGSFWAWISEVTPFAVYGYRWNGRDWFYFEARTNDIATFFCIR